MSVRDHLWGEPADPRVAVLGVRPVQERLAQSPGRRDASTSLWDIGSVCEDVARRFGRWMVVAHRWPAVGLGHPQVSHQPCHRFGGHPAATVGLNRSVAWLNPLLVAGLLQQRLGQARALPLGHHPAHDIAPVEVADDRERVLAPRDRSVPRGDVPRLELVGCGGQPLWLLIMGPPSVGTALTDLGFPSSQAIPRPGGAVREPVIQEGGRARYSPHFRYRAVCTDGPATWPISNAGCPCHQGRGCQM